MNIVELYKKESTESLVPALITTMISGIAQGALLGVIIIAASAAANDDLSFRYFLLFAISFAIVVIGKRYSMTRSLLIAENIVKNVRIRIGNKLRNSQLMVLENIGKEEIYTRIAQDTSHISESAILIINSMQSSVVFVFCTIFLAILSKLAFVITVSAIGVAVLLYMSQQESIAQELSETTKKETRFFRMLAQIIDGFKELRINQKKNDHHFESFTVITNEASDLKIKTGLKFVTEVMFSQVFFYTLIGVIIFILPRFALLNGEVVIRIAATILFIIGPVNLMVSSIPVVARANNAVRNLYSLEERLDVADKDFKIEGKPSVRKIESFNEIKFENVSFSYKDRYGTPLFMLGPVNMSVTRGEILFIVGGNGSGKTTLLKLLTGLYYPDPGTAIRLDNMAVDKRIYPAYRELFSVIFHEFHLFNRLYGLDLIDYDKVNELLKLMKLDKKTELIDDAFTEIQLSTGQRKRLAMIVALLDNRPIYVFDEWAADQDPIFRKYFYEVLLKDFKEQGKTIIAVSHDDRYFHFADKVLKMEFGNFI